MFVARRIFVSGLVLGVGLIGPAVSQAAASGTKLPLNGKSKGVASVDTSTNPSPLTFSSTGHLSHLGAFVAVGNELAHAAWGAAGDSVQHHGHRDGRREKRR